ncbi:MAG: lipid-A-disaccharide synthase [Marinifilaceae bacterium]|nr:lipid-A-disaccharide synthase [Marinifilaceae bacterium]
MKYYVIAGEASGDLHASNLIKALAVQDSAAEFRGWGGDLMQQAGCTIVRHYKESAIMGFFTVLTHLNVIKRNIEHCCRDLKEWNPDVVILVDYGGFNMRIAKYTKSVGIKTFYYISPKIWAWNTGRVEKIKKSVDAMFAIFPFEVDFYKERGYNKVFYAGNPLTDAIANRPEPQLTFDEFIKRHNLPNKPIVALVAGSRKQELKNMLPKMLEMIPYFPDYQFIIAGAPSMSTEDYKPYLKGIELPIIFGETYQIISQSRGALVTSGTATLETALLHTPQVVCYAGEGGAFYYALFKLFVKVKYISLVNLIMNRESVVELLMHKLNKKNLLRETGKILEDGTFRTKQLADYQELTDKVGAPDASSRFATLMIQELTGTK